MPVRNKMIKAREAYEKVSALLDEQALAECEKIGLAIDKSAKSGATCLVWGVNTQLYSRVIKMLREYDYTVSRYNVNDYYYDHDDDGKISIEISWHATKSEE
jgi:hypothetical protein